MSKVVVSVGTPLFLLLAFLALLGREWPCWGENEGSGEGKRAIVVVLNGISWADIGQCQAPNLQGLIRQGSIGLLSTRTFVFRSQEGAFETLGAGSRAVSLWRCADALSRWEHYQGEAADKRYQRFSGVSAGEAAVLVPRIRALQEDNRRLRFLVRPGLLGETLASAGLATAVLGNEDTDLTYLASSLAREAVGIAMTAEGKVRWGDVGKDLLLPDPVFGAVTNGHLLAERFKECYQQASLIVVDLGDTGRAMRKAGYGSSLVRAGLEREDRNLGLMLKSVDWARSRLYLLSPTASMVGKHPFAPIVVYGAGIPVGLLTSATTGQRGLVCNVDLLPSILEFLGVAAPPLTYGRQMRSQASGQSRLAGLLRMEMEAGANLWMRPIIQAGVASYLFLALVLALFSMFYPGLKVAARGGLLLSLGLVFGLVVLPMLVPMRYGLGPQVGALVALSVALLLTLRTRLEIILAVIGAAMFVIICSDQLVHTNLTLDTPIGSSSLAARRFYGLGNALMAYLVASCLLFLPLLLGRRSELGPGLLVWVLLLFVCTILLVGAPTLGANVGGVLTVATTLSLAFSLLVWGRIGWQGWVAALTVALFFLGMCLLLDLNRPVSTQTHLGRNVAFLKAEGFNYAWKVVSNKLYQSGGMLISTPFMPFFIPIFLAMFYAVLKPFGIFGRLFAARPYYHRCLKAAMFGSVIGALTNDSGIIIPLLIFSLLAPATFLLALAPAMGAQAADH